MSAITGIGDSRTIVLSASTSLSRGTAQRIRSPPAAATARIWRSVASTSAVSVLVIDWTTTGAPPPIGTPPTLIWRSEGTPQGYAPRRICKLRAPLLRIGTAGSFRHEGRVAAPLYKLGRFCIRRRWPVVAAWLVVAIVLVVLAARVGSETNDDLT